MDRPRQVCFGGWTVDLVSGEAVRNGQRVRLPSQPLQVLDELVANPGHLVTREQLIARLWPRGVVDFDTALNSAVRRLRTALDDRAIEPRYVETIPKRGYRFIAALEPPPAGHAPLPPVAAPTPSTPTASRGHRFWEPLAAAAGIVVLVVGGVLMWRAPAVTATLPVASQAVEVRAAEARHQQARFLLQRREPGDVAQARRYFYDALQADPSMARAWSGIASTHWIESRAGSDEQRVPLARMHDAARRALELDPDNAEALLRLANHAAIQGNRALAEERLAQAIRSAPDDPLVLSFRADRAMRDGDAEEALRLQRAAVEADPLSAATRFNLAAMLYVQGRLVEAVDVLREVRELRPANVSADAMLGQLLVILGQPEAAYELGRGMSDGAAKSQLLALSLYALGRDREAEAALQALRGTRAAGRSLLLAEVHAWLGEADQAFMWLEAATTDPCPGDSGCWPADWWPRLPLLQPLHDDPRWSTWVSRASGSAVLPKTSS
jgi:DNA-binding winged helix-turn-helix (wHTH) protein/tetratricopeptide (TPR) repeat protein